MNQQLSDGSHDLVTLTFNLGGHSAYLCYGSSCFICVPSLNFLGLPVQKILCIYCVSINRLGDLDLLPFKLVCFLPILVFFGLVILHLWANKCQTNHVTLCP